MYVIKNVSLVLYGIVFRRYTYNAAYIGFLLMLGKFVFDRRAIGALVSCVLLAAGYLCAPTHARTHARTHAPTHPRTHPRTHDEQVCLRRSGDACASGSCFMAYTVMAYIVMADIVMAVYSYGRYSYGPV